MTHVHPPEIEIFNFPPVQLQPAPFPHLTIDGFLDERVAASLLRWLESEASWTSYEVLDFARYYDVNPRTAGLYPLLNILSDDVLLAQMAARVQQIFRVTLRPYVDMIAHKLIPGQSVGIHTDYDAMQTHRLIIHLNRGWTAQNGGVLLLHDEDDPAVPPSRRVPPIHRRAVAFEISPRSLHSISRVERGERYSLVYTFFRA